MGETKIEWTNWTFNPWWGCVKVSPGCKNCYAQALDNRWHKTSHWGPGSSRKPASEKYWNQLFKWDKESKAAGKKGKVFVASMADVFEDHPEVIHSRMRLFELIPRLKNLIFQLLTKRPENINRFIPSDWKENGWPENIWMGTSVENQAMADLRIPILEATTARIKFLSVEPMLGGINLERHLWPYNWNDNPVKWIICGGESGPGSRTIERTWIENLQEQCMIAGVAFFFKQWGGVNKKESGRMLNGKQYSEFPE